MLKIKNLSVSVDKKKIIDNFSFNFEKDKVYVIMGPNGSGKSSLANAISGHPLYKTVPRIKSTKLLFNSEDILDMPSDKRANLGIFLSFQSPYSLAGVNIFQLLLVALKGKKDPLLLRREIRDVASELKIKEDLISRSLNEGASGGEKKKLEMLQVALLDPKLVIFDEIDTGVDVDALKTIASFMHKIKKNKTFIIITHYNRIFKYIKPDHVLVLAKGKLIKEGTASLAEKIENEGYEKVILDDK